MIGTIHPVFCETPFTNEYNISDWGRKKRMWGWPTDLRHSLWAWEVDLQIRAEWYQWLCNSYPARCLLWSQYWNWFGWYQYTAWLYILYISVAAFVLEDLSLRYPLFVAWILTNPQKNLWDNCLPYFISFLQWLLYYTYYYIMFWYTEIVLILSACQFEKLVNFNQS